MRGQQDSASVRSVPIDIMNVTELVEAVASDVAARRPTVYAGVYAAQFHQAARKPEYRQLLWQTRNYPDGAGVVWALGRQNVAADRTPLTDTIHDVLRVASELGWRVYLYGGTAEVNEKVVDLIEASYPGCKIVGARHGYEEIVPETIAEARPDLTLVARGPVRQERWAVNASRHLNEVGKAIGPIMTCGGLFDFLAGARPRAPRWMQQCGLEWLFRTMLEPHRLLKRYAIGNAWFIAHYLVMRTPIPTRRALPGLTPAIPRPDPVRKRERVTTQHELVPTLARNGTDGD